MQGLELSRLYWEKYGEPMLREDFPELVGFIAAGLVGSGSECLGFDDEISTDHDFEPGFCLFLPGEDLVDSRAAFRLERAYARLPNNFEGFERLRLSPAGGSRHGVIRISDFYKSKVGVPDGRLSLEEWVKLPEFYLAEATNGEVFTDPFGLFTEIRERLKAMPQDAVKKKIARSLLSMAQSGQYNYERCVKRRQLAAAQLSVVEFVNSAIAVAFLLNGRYMPYYKWKFKALEQFHELSELSPIFEYLLTTPNDEDVSKEKYICIEETAEAVINVLEKRGMTRAVCGELQKHASSVNDTVSDAALRNAPL